MKKGYLLIGKIKGVWHSRKGRLKQHIGTITGNDSLFQQGLKEEMAGRLQMKLNLSLKDILVNI